MIYSILKCRISLISANVSNLKFELLVDLCELFDSNSKQCTFCSQGPFFGLTILHFFQ